VQSHKRMTLLAFVLATLSAPSPAQDMPELAPGARLRVARTSINGLVVGTVVVADGRGLTLDIKGKTEPLLVLYRDITSIEVSRGGRSRGKGAQIGALVGAAAGILLGVGACGNNCAVTTGSAAVMLGGMGAGGGALLGAVVTPGERWEKLPWKQSAGAQGWQKPGSHGLVLSMSIRF
jgi:hypothetical protein